MTQEALVLPKGAPPPKLTFFDRFSTVSFKLFGGQAVRLVGSMPLLRQDLLKSNLRITPEGLISVAFFSTFISALVVAGLAVIAVVRSFPLLLFAAPLPVIVLILVLNGPKISQSSRSSRLDDELPFMIGYMSILSGGGLPLMSIIRRISEMKIFPAAGVEAKRILVDVDYYGYDPISALERAAKYNPNKTFAELLSGYTTVVSTGGDHINYLNQKVKEAFEAREAKIRRTVDTTGMLAEAYLVITVVLGVTLFSLYLLQSLLFQNSSGLQSVSFYAYILVPILSVTFAWLLDSTQAKWPYTDMRPYKIFAASIPIGVALFFLPLPLPLYLHLSVALIATTAVPAFYNQRYSRERRGMEKMLPDFILDVAEGRKIGLSPERSIERLVDRNYGPLSKYVAKMGSQLTWGISLSNVVSSFTTAVTSWITKAVGTLMIEVVEVGGGTVGGFSEMADFTKKIGTLESDRRSSLRHYIMIVYIAGIMVVLVTAVMLSLLSSSAIIGLQGSQTKIDPKTVDYLLASSIFEGWVMGFVAGKMGESSVAEGFKHSVIMVGISLVSILIARSFIAFPV